MRPIIKRRSGLESEFVTLEVFDDLGREVATLVNRVRPVGALVETVRMALIKWQRAEAFVAIAPGGPNLLPSPPKIRIFMTEISF